VRDVRRDRPHPRERAKALQFRHHLALALPLCGAACIGVLWLNLEPASFELGLIWAALGAIYLLLRLTVFRVRLGRPEQDAS
jgi:4-hydroxybenzoate polyprenyltransferase